MVYGAGARIFQPAAHFGGQSPRGGEMNILKKKYCYSALNIFLIIEPNKINFH